MRSALPMESLQESVDAAATVGNVLQKGLAQYPTPPAIAERLAEKLLSLIGFTPKSAVDPQCHQGNLLEALPWSVQLFGIELDNQFKERSDRITRLTANCVRASEIMEEVDNQFRFDLCLANYPFGLMWKERVGEGKPERKVSSFHWTTDFAFRHARAGYIIGPVADIEQLTDSRLGCHNIRALHREQFKWPEANVIVSVLYWERLYSPDTSTPASLSNLFSTTALILQDEKRATPPFNIWLQQESKVSGRQAKIGAYLSTRQKLEHKLTDADVKRLLRVAGQTPASMAVDVETRLLLKDLIESQVYTIQPEARTAIERAIDEARSVATPILPVTDFERVAYVDEESHLECVQTWPTDRPPLFVQGQRYRLSSHSYTFKTSLQRRKPHYDEETGTTSIETHDCELTGQDRFIRVHHETGSLDFRDKPDPERPFAEVPELWLWRIFKKPPVPTVADRFPAQWEDIKARMRALESIGDFRFYPGQFDYLSRMLLKDWALFAAEGGVGKSLFAITSFAIKDASRCLICCPKGTVVPGHEEESSQWIDEITAFAPHLHVYPLFSKEDYYRLLAEHEGELPHGFYVTYYEALTNNDAVEHCPGGEFPSWRDDRLYQMTGAEPPSGSSKDTTLVQTIGSHGPSGGDIRCVVSPSLLTLCGHWFDQVCLDEAHNIKGLDAARTDAILRLQPAYRYAFTATPVHNTAEDIFTLFGWLCVPDWWKGERYNAAFPYTREQSELFLSHFLTTERDHTAERKIVTAGGKRRKVERKSPVLSSPARLLKIVKPTMGYIDKARCNPAYRKPEVIDVRVPMGERQAALYAHYMNIGNVPTKGSRDARTRRARQIGYLRDICTAPASAKCNFENDLPADQRATSNFTPKVVSILELTRDLLREGEQVVIVNARIAVNDAIHDRLTEAGIPVSRIDSSPRSGNHSEEANLFKQGHTRVMLMGIKCAVGHSFSNCRRLIISSLEYAPGALDQACWRVDRINTKDAKIYCILHAGSYEETQFDTVALKGDASQIILQGRRVQRDLHTPDMGELLAASMISWDHGPKTISESLCEQQWPTLRDELATSINS